MGSGDGGSGSRVSGASGSTRIRAVAIPPPTITIQEKPRILVVVTPASQPNANETIHADAAPVGMGGVSWTSSNTSKVNVIGSGASCTVIGLASGTVTVTATYQVGTQNVSDTIEVIAYSIAIEHPNGDPIAAGSATNEFTYSGAAPGVMTFECRAKVDPDNAHTQADADDKLRWAVDTVGNSALSWSVPDAADATLGKGRVSTATFTGLPQRHDDFGPKVVTLRYVGTRTFDQTTKIEVFWAKTSTNHPGDNTPNWYFYWRQVIGEGHMQHVRYGGAGTGDFAEVPAMTGWGYGAVLNKNRMLIYDPANAVDNGVAGVHGRITGIDLFYNTFVHERQHVRQIARADPVVGIHAGTCWANGWSWNVRSNHYRLAAGRAAGAGGICTAAGPGTLGQAGTGDIKLDPGFNHWPSAWGAVPAPASPAGGYIGGHPIEQKAYQQETGREHALAKWDWGAPGKNHRTVNKHDD